MKTPPFTINSRVDQEILLIEMIGYCEEKGGEQMLQIVEVALEKKQNRVVIDLSRCSVMNSFGISRIYEITERVVEDFGGSVVLVKPNELLRRALTMSGIFNVADLAPSLEEAIKLCQA
jgi:anti-anti-sigma factor